MIFDLGSSIVFTFSIAAYQVCLMQEKTTEELGLITNKIMFVCVTVLSPSQHLFSHVGTINLIAALQQQRCRPVCLSEQSGQYLCYSLSESITGKPVLGKQYSCTPDKNVPVLPWDRKS